MTIEELAEILEQSKLYWNTCRSEGSIADLHNADLRGADLRYADLRGANLGDANLHHADLRGADLRNANLRGAHLRYADLRGAHLRYADLRGANLGGGQNPIDSSIFGIKSVDLSLPLRVANAVLEPNALDMGSWHTCETTHCLAGWAVHLSGAAGYALQSVTSPSVAGCMLMPSASHLFYGTNGQAIEWAKSVVAEAEGVD